MGMDARSLTHTGYIEWVYIINAQLILTTNGYIHTPHMIVSKLP